MKNNNQNPQMSMFSHPQEKGMREWAMFNVIRNDNSPGAYRVATPRKAEEPRYPNIIRITRLPRHITPRPAL